jgi:hypothetical protein
LEKRPNAVLERAALLTDSVASPEHIVAQTTPLTGTTCSGSILLLDCVLSNTIPGSRTLLPIWKSPMREKYRNDSPDDAPGAAFILLAVGVLIVAGVIITAALLIARHLG